jgi:hypothetical protein
VIAVSKESRVRLDVAVSSRRTILRNIASTTAINTAVLLDFLHAAERLCNEISLEGVHFGRIGGTYMTLLATYVSRSLFDTAEVADAVK